MNKAFLVLVLLLALTACTDRQQVIHERGSQVMPFSLDETTHVFKTTESGGLQQVVADNQTDRENVAGIRTHLQTIAKEFADGNFSDPQALHGERMPGVQVLEARHENLTVNYTQLPRGAQIMYASQDLKVVTAVHDWFEAQLQDHGADATGEPTGCEVPEGHDPQMWRMHNDC